MRVPTIFSVLLFMLVFPPKTVSQRIIVNSRGERIVTYPDGSWRNVVPGDSTLIRQYLQNAEKINSNTSGEIIGDERNKGERQEHLLRQWEELYKTVIAEEKITQQAFRQATNAQFNAGAQLRNAETNKKLMEPDRLASLQDEYDKSVLTLKNAKLRQKEIRKLLGQAEKLNRSLPGLSDRKLHHFRSRFNLYLAEFNPSGTAAPDPAPKKTVPPLPKNQPVTSKPIPVPSASPKIDQKTNQDFDKMMPASRRPVPYASEHYKCLFTLDTTDTVTGRRRIETQPSLIFTYTDPDLRPYFKDKDLITCRGRLSKIGPYIYLTIEFQIASSHSQSNFGSLQNGSLLRFRLLNGEYVTMHNIKSDRGRIDPYSGHTIFSGQYALGKEEIKKLMKSGLDKMRVLWETGYEDYEVYYVDFLSNQLHCLMSK